jgi:adenosylcobinamide kinase/adenosylcobinamide-phosphate guanylyltransferase
MSLAQSVHLILGGARSGKSRFTESVVAQFAQTQSQPVAYIATAQARDEEMQQRIQQHQQDRPNDWCTYEVTQDLAAVIVQAQQNHSVIMVDCLTLWMMGLMEDGDSLTHHVDELIQVLTSSSVPVYLVSNEISMGVVPMGELSRKFVDELGRLHQHIAQIANSVTLMVAGIPHPIKNKI